jgi:hypothetical protein
MKAKRIVASGMKAVIALLLFGAFTIGCWLAPLFVLALLFPSIRKIEYIMNFVKAADRMLAAVLGYSGRFMLSTECAHAPCLAKLRDVLDWLEENHCAKSAYGEGAYCRLSDHKIGHK